MPEPAAQLVCEHGPQFAARTADIIGLYQNPPKNAMVISVDEKTSIQALECATGYLKTSDGKIARGIPETPTSVMAR